ncbi:MAG: glycosyltransferase family 2 protein [Planctomycetes bacterium]|nr:glycosyltransferase family 2 protein [Planctomycetota bacterium]
MPDLIESSLTWIQCALLVPLAALGLHRGWIVMLYLATRHRRRANAPTPEIWPRVTVQLPIFNERLVAARLIECVAGLDYPRDRLQIQVLDDSTDDTSGIVARAIEGLPADLDVEHRRRSVRTGYKAGALAEGLDSATGDFLAIFDADFLPPSDFLRRTVAEMRDGRIGMVQARWGHVNPDFSLLTDVQRTLLDGHFVVEHRARAETGCFFNFNGTAGLFRRECIEDAGGWQHDTLTEDMDLSYRAQLRGWKFRYLHDLVCPAELPIEMNAFLSQQHRWAKGSLQTARKLLGRILRAPIPWFAKGEATVHLLGNVAFPLLFGLILVALPLQIVRAINHSEVPSWLCAFEATPLLFATGCLLLYYATARYGAGTLRVRTILRLPLVFAIGAGMCVNNTAAVLSAMRRHAGEFRRTPKRNAGNDRHSVDAPAYRSTRGIIPFVEGALALCAATTSLIAWSIGVPGTAIFHGLFAIGLGWTSVASIAEDRRPPSAPAVQGRMLAANP